jgi:hypothetical protein
MTEHDDATTRDLAWVAQLDYWGRRVLAFVLLLALVFTMVNVQQFAANDEPGSWWWWTIAWLLDPMCTLTAVTAIVFEVVLADHGKPRVYWLTATKWYALGCTWAMNIWSSAAKQDAAGILLHSVAPGLVFLLAESAPRVRTYVAQIVSDAKAAESIPARTNPVQPQPQPEPVPLPAATALVSPPVVYPVVTPPAPPVTERPATRGKATTGGGQLSDELLRQAREWKAGRVSSGQPSGWRPLQTRFHLTQGAARELARRLNNPTQLEAVS